MATIQKFNKTTIEQKILPRQKQLKPGKQEIYWDGHLSGFGLKITPQKAVYVVQRRVTSRNGSRTVRSIIGGYRELPVEDARELAADALKKLRHGTDLIAEKKAAVVAAKTLQQVLDEYLEKYGTRLRPKTKDVYKSAVRRCFHDWITLPITSIDEEMVADKQTELSNAHGPRGKGEAQANQAMRVLRTLFNFAMLAYKDAKKQPLIVTNPVRGLKSRRLWNKTQSRDEIIADDDLEAWYQAVMGLKNVDIRDYMLLCLFTGLRRSEAANLKWDCVRLHGKKPMLTIPAPDTKTNSEHQLPLPEFVVHMLDRRDKVRRINNKFVFPGEKPNSHIVEPKRAIAQVVEKSGVDFSMHTLRRTFGTIAGRLDIAHYKHKMLMNHSMKTEVTGSHYVKLTVEDLREPMQKIADHIQKQTGIGLDQSKRAT
jgi:integrase